MEPVAFLVQMQEALHQTLAGEVGEAVEREGVGVVLHLCQLQVNQYPAGVLTVVIHHILQTSVQIVGDELKIKSAKTKL